MARPAGNRAVVKFEKTSTGWKPVKQAATDVANDEAWDDEWLEESAPSAPSRVILAASSAKTAASSAAARQPVGSSLASLAARRVAADEAWEESESDEEEEVLEARTEADDLQCASWDEEWIDDDWNQEHSNVWK